jgi:hypothetical protein
MAVWSFSARLPKRSQPPTPPPAGAAALAARIGLVPESLAAAGVSIEQLQACLAATKEVWMNEGRALMAQDDAIAQSDRNISDIQRAIAAGHPPADAQNTLATLQNARQASASSRQNLLENAFQTATEGLTAEQVLTLQTIRRNSPWSVPTQYLVSDRTPRQWVALQHAGTPRVDPRNPVVPRSGMASPADTDSVLQAANAELATASAAARIAAHRGELEALWTQMLRQAP